MAADSPDVRTLEVRGWLLRASEDLRAGRHDLTAVPPLVNDVALHAQQCTEKAMKALLVHREQAFRKTHNLTELGGAVARIEPSLAAPGSRQARPRGTRSRGSSTSCPRRRGRCR
jgi:hypothetical protein